MGKLVAGAASVTSDRRLGGVIHFTASGCNRNRLCQRRRGVETDGSLLNDLSPRLRRSDIGIVGKQEQVDSTTRRRGGRQLVAEGGLVARQRAADLEENQQGPSSSLPSRLSPTFVPRRLGTYSATCSTPRTRTSPMQLGKPSTWQGPPPVMTSSKTGKGGRLGPPVPHGL